MIVSRSCMRLPRYFTCLVAGFVLGLGVGHVTSTTNGDGEVDVTLGETNGQSTRGDPKNPEHYVIGFTVAEEARLKHFNWSPSEIEDFVGGLRDSLRHERPRVTGGPAEYAHLQQKVIDRIQPERDSEKKLPATLGPLLEAYREGAYAQNLRAGTVPFPPHTDAIEVRFTSAFIDQNGRPSGEISSSMILRMGNLDSSFRRTLERAKIGGRITAVIPARFLGSGELIRSRIHPDESIVFTLLLDLPAHHRSRLSPTGENGAVPTRIGNADAQENRIAM